VLGKSVFTFAEHAELRVEDSNPKHRFVVLAVRAARDGGVERVTSPS
jgi:hypothetical protein